MKRTIISALTIVAFLAFNVSVFAQSNADFDSRLLSKFSKKEIKKLSNAELEYWTYYLENSFEIVDIPKEKPDAVPATITLSSMDKSEINVFKLGLKSHEFARDYVRIEGTNKMLVILPLSEIDKNFKAH